MPCKNGGICRNFNSTSYVCRCPRGWTGTICETQIDFCNPNPCKNGEKCSYIGYLDYSCSCTTSFGSNYSGKNCDILNYCNSAPCLNGGECFNTNSSYRCMCPPGFAGAQCQNQINYCDPNPCQNGGTCQQWGFFGYMCSCSANYTGQHCEAINYCNTNNQPCLNDGKCFNTRKSYLCECSQWFTGKNCQTLYNYCSIYQPCLNGAICSSCYNNTNCQSGALFQCTCASGFGGLNCNGYFSSSACSSACRGRTCQSSNNVYYCPFNG